LALGYDGDYTNSKRYVVDYRSEEGCEAQTQKQVELQVRIPLLDNTKVENELDNVSNNLYKSLKSQVSEDERELLKGMSTSIMGQIISIWYEVHVFVKHSAWNEFGSGQYVSIPILIVPKN